MLCYNLGMNNLADTIRQLDFNTFYYLYSKGLESHILMSTYTFFARYGIVFSLFSFAYLIWMKRINAFLCSFVAMAIAGSFDLLIFIFWRRPRPFVSHSDLISLPNFTYDDIERMSSFPSSHTYIAFAIATSVFLYGHRRLGTVLFVLAIALAIGRIGIGLHYPSDILGGAILGIWSGVFAHRWVEHSQKYWEYEKGNSPLEDEE